MSTKQTAFRLPEPLVQRLDRFVSVLAERSGLSPDRVNRTDAVVYLLDRALTREGISEE
jgi:predicted DNA-binding protein